MKITLPPRLYSSRRTRAVSRRLLLASLASFVASLSGANGLLAQDPEPLVTDRPDRTESTHSIPAGFAQFEVGWTYIGNESMGETRGSHSLPEALLRVGIGGGFEARVGFSGFIFEDGSVAGTTASDTHDSGAGDTSLGLKLEVARWTGGRIAVLGSASLPTGADGFSSQRVDPAFLLLVSHPLGDRFGVGYNVGLRWATESDASGDLDTQLEAPYSLSLGVAVTDRLSAFLEGFGAFGLDSNRPAEHSLDSGFVLLLTNVYQLDVSGGVGLNEAADDWFIGAGFSVRVPG